MRRLILDGGMSRELIRLNAPFRQPEWSALALLEAPHLVRQVHVDFAAAGADVLTTNSYALVPFHIGEARFKKQGQELAALAGRLAREAADQEAVNGRKVLVAGSLPPVFGSYQPDLFDPEHAHEYLEVLVRGLAPYVDVWLGETLSLVAEAKAVQRAIQATGKGLWIAFTLHDVGDAIETSVPRLRSGELVADAARWALDTGVEALLFNCSRPEFMDAAIRVARGVFVREASSRRGKVPSIGVYANAFTPKAASQPANVGLSATRSDLTEQPYLTFAQKWVASGASIVGGCCGIGCDHVHQLAQAFKREDSRDVSIMPRSRAA